MVQTPDTWHRVTAAFEQATALEGVEREAYLVKLLHDDPDVGKEVLSLVGHHVSSEAKFLESPIGLQVAEALLEKELACFREGDVFGDFKILHLLGSGAFANVYLAHQQSLERAVALKVSTNVGKEAQTMAHLQHESIVSVFSVTVDKEQSLQTICMQYVPGCTLEKALSNAAITHTVLSGSHLLTVIANCSSAPAVFDPQALKDRDALLALDAVDTVAWLGVRLADALAYAHGKGVLHLDIKPGNILLTPYGRPMLTDFNVSMDAAARGNEHARLLGGTMGYMSPEQQCSFASGGENVEDIDAQSDVYSLGVVLKEMVGAIRGTFVHSSYLDRVLAQATAPDRQTRFRSAAEFSAALAGCLEIRAIYAHLPPPTPLVQWSAPNPMWFLGVLIVLVQAAACIVNIAYNYSRIVSHLTAEQQSYFQVLCAYWNPAVYAISMFLLIRSQYPIHQFCKNPHSLSGMSALAQIRARILWYPYWVAAVTTACWGAAAFFFPGMLDQVKGPVEPWVYHHFFISFFISGLIAVTYSFLFAQFLGVRVVYPRAWAGCRNIRSTARKELAPVQKWMRFFHGLAGLIPLVGAVALLFLEPVEMSTTEHAVYRGLLLSLIVMGMAGFVFALKGSEQLSRTLTALTGADR